MRAIAKLILLTIAGLVVVGAAYSARAGGAPLTFMLTSSAFSAGGEIPVQETCKGADLSPALEWSGVPRKTVSFALILDDPDAPHGTWVHWVMWDMPASLHSLPQAIAKRETLDDGSHQGQNDFHKNGYNGPCPPGGATHRYFFHLYALDTKLDLAPGADRAALDAAMKGHILAQAEYMGTFHK